MNIGVSGLQQNLFFEYLGDQPTIGLSRVNFGNAGL